MQVLRDDKLGSREDKLTLVQSYIAWWDMAGFDNAVDSKIVNWLEEKAKKASPKNESSLDIRDSSKSVAPSMQNRAHTSPQNNMVQSSTPTRSIVSQDNWPATLSELHKSIERGDALPGNIYGNECIAPHYLQLDNENADENQKVIMLISDYPNGDNLSEKSLFSRKENQLIVNMLTAADFQKHNIYCASLASTRPIYDELPEQDLPLIHTFIRHHIEILDPDVLISLGSAACNALLNAELMKSRGNLHYFNLNNKDKELLTTFHPKTLLANARMKEKAWRDLQLLMKKDIL